MGRLNLHLRAVLFAALPPLLNACAAYHPSGVSPTPSRLASVTTRSGMVVVFDSLPAPQITGDTIHGSQAGVPCAIPTSDVAVARWIAASSAETATHATGRDRPAGLHLAAVGQGAHVRITAPSLGWDGKTRDVVALRGDTLLLRRAGGLLGLMLAPSRIPLSAVTTLELSLNHDAHNAALVVGGLVGGAGGALAGYALSDRAPCDTGWAGLGCGLNRSFGDIGATMLGAGLGALLGGLIADAAVPERWAVVSLPRPRVGLVPLPSRRVGLGVSLAF